MENVFVNGGIEGIVLKHYSMFENLQMKLCTQLHAEIYTIHK